MSLVGEIGILTFTQALAEKTLPQIEIIRALAEFDPIEDVEKSVTVIWRLTLQILTDAADKIEVAAQIRSKP